MSTDPNYAPWDDSSTGVITFENVPENMVEIANSNQEDLEIQADARQRASDNAINEAWKTNPTGLIWGTINKTPQDNAMNMTEPTYSLKAEEQNVIDNYDWTPTPKKIRDTIGIPSISLEEFELDSSYLTMALKNWIFQISNFNAQSQNKDPYYGMYIAKPTNTTFKLPYYQSYHHMINNTWSGRESGLKSAIETSSWSNVIATIFDITKMGIDTTEEWLNSDKATYDVEFMLFNTLQYSNKEQIAMIHKHRKLIERLIYASLPTKRSVVTVGPPCIYKVYIPGIRFSPASVIQNVTIENVGHMNQLSNYGSDSTGVGSIVPDAWRIKLSIRDLIRESRQIFNEASVEINVPNRAKIQAIVEDSKSIAMSLQEGYYRLKENMGSQMLETAKEINKKKNNK